MEQAQRPIKKRSKLHRRFQAIADTTTKVVGSPFWFVFSVSIVVTWFFSGFFIGFTETWQLIINTSTTILTFLMISLLHSSQKKWEDKMERMQDREATTIKEIKKETKKIAMESPHKPAQENQQVNEPEPQTPIF
jgi:low affinity Fe/Cu permease